MEISQVGSAIKKSILTPTEIAAENTGQLNLAKNLFHRHYTQASDSAYDLIEWETRTASITNDRGEVVFEQKNVEVPKFWSQMATNVVASKYFRGDLESSTRETSVRALITRVVDTIASWGVKDGYFKSTEETEIFRDELTHILLHQIAAFNSPVWFNVGVQAQPQCSACFIVAVEDTIDSLLELQAVEGKLFKWGSGTGTNLSTLRSSREKLSGGGRPSGPVSFMQGFDAWAGIIKSGGKTRRAAKMQILNSSHPDIREFINCKVNEEKKAWALMEQGYDGGFAIPGGAYDSVRFQNANLSVRVDDRFMQAVQDESMYSTRNVSDGEICETHDARKLMQEIAEATYLCGDPGLQFDDIINAWHTCPASGRINASNPCSEYMHLDDSACNLSSLNLLKFLNSDGSFDLQTFRHAAALMIIAQDILVSNSSYPTKKIETCANNFRQLGLGYANLGALLMNLGMPYDSDEARQTAAAITAVMTGQAYCTSALLAKNLTAFNGFKKNRTAMLKVIAKHRAEVEKLSPGLPNVFKETACSVWEEALSQGERYGYRNAQVTVLAPTGTISFMMDCDTTGIEPEIALVKYKKLVGGGVLKLVNTSVSSALQRLNYSAESISQIINYLDKHGTIEGAPKLKPEHLAVFDCAFKSPQGQRFIQYQGHLKMMAAAQPFISGAISKTVNLPHDVSVEEIFKIYLDAWRMGLKAVALYRDGSKRTQPLTTSIESQQAALAQPVRRRLADEREAITHKFRVGGLEGYLTVGLFEDRTPGEIFLVVAKEGSTLSGVMDAFATTISMALQYGVPLSALVKKFTYMRFEPAGFTNNKEIPSAQSIIDYVFRWLAIKFLSPSEIEALGLKQITTTSQQGSPVAKVSSSNLMSTTFSNSEDAPPCLNCGSNLMVRQAGCYVCLNCGAQGGCG